MHPGSWPAERFQARKVMLQGVFHLLSVEDIRLGRLVCKEWAAELASSVHSILLPAGMWQMREKSQQSHLDRLTSIYQSCRHAMLTGNDRHTVDEQALLQLVTALKRLRSLSSIAVTNVGPSSSCWTVILQTLTVLSGQLTSLTLSDVRLPGRQGLNALTQLTSIQQLTISSGCANKLQQQHVAAVGSMQQLKRLRLSFRVVDGTLLDPLTLDCLGQLSKLEHLEVIYTGMSELSTGVCFVSKELLSGCTVLSSLVLSRVPAHSFRGLHKLQRLQHLSVTQLARLTEDQVRSLGHCTQLRELRVRPIPLELMATLAQLTALTMLQASLWSPPQAGGAVLPARGIVALQALRNLNLLALSGPVAIQQEDVQSLSMAWKELRSLDLHVSLPQGTQGFAGFRQLQVLRLKPWTSHCTFTTNDEWPGSDEALSCSHRGIQVCEDDLPQGLRELDGQDLVFSPAFSDRQTSEGARLPPLDSRSRGARCLRVLKLRYSLDTLDLNPPLVVPGQAMLGLQGLQQLEIQHPHITSHQLAALTAECSSTLTYLSINTADAVSQLRKPLTALPFSCAQQAAGSGGLFSSSSADSNGLVPSCLLDGGKAGNANTGSCSRTSDANVHSFYSNTAAAAAAAAVVAAGPVAAAAGLPVAGITVASLAATAAAAAAGAAVTALARSNFLSPQGHTSPEQAGCNSGSHSRRSGLAQRFRNVWQSITAPYLPSVEAAFVAGIFNNVCFVNDEFHRGAHRMSHTSFTGLSCMGSGLCEGQGLAVLAQCIALQELSVVVGDRALGHKFRAAVASLPQLHRLSAAIASDHPSTAAKALGQLIGNVALAQQLQSVALGMESPGASEDLQDLLEWVSAALPACQVSMLKAPLL